MKTINIGIIGAGRIGKIHADHLRACLVQNCGHRRFVRRRQAEVLGRGLAFLWLRLIATISWNIRISMPC